MGLNDPDSIIASSRQAERARQARLASELRSGLAGLPKPQNEYEIRVPEADEDGDEEMTEAVEEDAADVAARRKARQKEREEAELRKRSQVSLLCQCWKLKACTCYLLMPVFGGQRPCMRVMTSQIWPLCLSIKELQCVDDV